MVWRERQVRPADPVEATRAVGAHPMPGASEPPATPSCGASAGELLPAEAHLAALSALPGMGPARLRSLLDVHPPDEAWRAALSGRLPPSVRDSVPGPVVDAWRAAAHRIDVGAGWEVLVEAGVGVAASTSAAFPDRLVDDPEPPAVLFHLGRPPEVSRPTVAVVGTRRSTRYGRDVAFGLGRALARADVVVVSGLALGIDAAAHRGALAACGAPPVAVVGTGLDVIYPRRNASLWHDVVAEGTVCTEAPLGTPPERWRFPARNRIIAGLADLVVVVESHERGGSMHTVAEAALRGVPVFAVPGPVTSAASVGTNRLLADGALPATDVDDLLVGLGLVAGERPPTRAEPDDAEQRAVLDSLGWRPATVDDVSRRTGHDAATVALLVEQLIAGGWLVQRGAWLERVASP